MCRHREQFDFEFKLSYFRLHSQPLRVILRLGLPQLIRSVSVHGSMIWVKANINIYGLTASATYSVGNKIEKFMNVFVDGVYGATGAMIGQNLGARKLERVNRTLKAALCCTLIFGAISASLFLLFPKFFFGIFTNDDAVIEYGVIFLRIMAVGCMVVSFSGCFKSIAIGTGAAGLCFIIGVLDGICRVLVCLFFYSVLAQGAQSYFWGAALCQLIPGLACFAYFISGKWKTRKLLSET
jgi:Na+-driven multidrug efflux pump